MGDFRDSSAQAVVFQNLEVRRGHRIEEREKKAKKNDLDFKDIGEICTCAFEHVPSSKDKIVKVIFSLEHLYPGQ